MIGGNGADHLAGECGPDEIDGGNGPDVLSGGAGPDVLTVGNGPDLFVFGAHSDRDNGHDGGHDGDHGDGHDVEPHSFASLMVDEQGGHGFADTITGFELGTDKIDLSALGVNLHWSAEPEAFGIWVTQDGHNTIVHADTNGVVNGSNIAEFSVVLVGIHAPEMSADDFVV